MHIPIIPAHERIIKIRPLVENSILRLLVDGIADAPVLFVTALMDFCGTALFPCEIDSDVQKDYQREQESANAPGKSDLREFATKEGYLGFGRNV